MEKSVVFGSELRVAIKETVTLLSMAVKSTLGPSGTNVGVMSEIMMPIIVNDGVTVAKKMVFNDPLQKYIADVLRTVSRNAENIAGDGTTTATTISEAIILDGIKNIEAGFSQVDIVKGIRMATIAVLKVLEEKGTSVIENKDILSQVATISANNDIEVGKLIANAFSIVKADGKIDVQDSTTGEDWVDFVDGMKYDSGIESNLFINTRRDGCILEDVSVLIYEGKLKSVEPIVDILQEHLTEDKAILIIADEYTQEAINDLANAKIQQRIKICAVRSPGYGSLKESNLEDIALITNAKIVSKRLGFDMEKVDVSVLGYTSNMKATTNDFTIINNNSDKEAIKEKVKTLKAESKNEIDRTNKSETLDRIAKLTSGVAILYVSGNSPIEVSEKKFRIEDAINATRASLEEGVVPGGGIALLKIAKSIEKPEFQNRDQELGFEILLSSLESPIRTICENAGKKSELIIKEVLSGDFNYGYDAKLDKYGDMFEAGILDPLKVTKSSLTSAASVSQMLLSTNCISF